MNEEKDQELPWGFDYDPYRFSARPLIAIWLGIALAIAVGLSRYF